MSREDSAELMLVFSQEVSLSQHLWIQAGSAQPPPAIEVQSS